MYWFKKLWNGEYPLWKTFWLFNVLVSYVICLSFVFFVAAFTKGGASGTLVWGMSTCLWVAYSFIALGGLWRSAQAYTGFWLWKYLSYLLTVVSGIKVGKSLILCLLVFYRLTS